MSALSALLLAGVFAAQEPAPEAPAEPVSFYREVRPLLQANCQGCHQPAKAEGDVVLVRHADLLRVTPDMDALVEPGSPERSLLIDVITPFESLAPEMPQDADPLSAEAVDLIRRWIVEGALDDGPVGLGRAVGEVPNYARPPVVTSIDYSPDGELLAVAGRGETLLHRSDGSGIVARLVGLSERIESLAFSPDGLRLAVAGGSPGRMGELQIWNVAAAQLELSIPVTFDTIQGASWSEDGSLVAFGCKDDSVRAVDSRSGAQVLYQKAHEDWVLGTAFSTDGSHLVSVGRDRSLKLVKVETQQFIDNITSITPGALRGGLMSVDRHPTRDELLVGGADGAPKTYRMYRETKRVIGDDYNLLQAFEALPGRVFRAAWSPDGARIAAASSLSGKGEVRVYTVESAERQWAHGFETGVYALAFHPAGDQMATAGFDGVVRLLDANDGTLTAEFVSVPLEGATWIEASAGVPPAEAIEAEATGEDEGSDE